LHVDVSSAVLAGRIKHIIEYNGTNHFGYFAKLDLMSGLADSFDVMNDQSQPYPAIEIPTFLPLRLRMTWTTWQTRPPTTPSGPPNSLKTVVMLESNCCKMRSMLLC
jgi:hypothetical protein